MPLLHGIGPKKATLMISKLGGVEPIFEEKLSVIQRETGIRKEILRLMKRDDALKRAEKEAVFAEKNNIQTHFFLDFNYPRRLRQCVDAPIVLFSKGNFDPNPSKTVAVVGTRNATDYGREICEELIESFSKTDIQVVSGMAYGIDICAHSACLKNNIQTVGVLGHGLDRIYPSIHRRIAEGMLENGGLLSEFLPGTKPDKENFPMRNRIVAGMSDATIVIESKVSGGSLITADLAFDYNKDVFAFPGNVGQTYSAGCNLLIQKNKAHLITNGSDFLNFMGWQSAGGVNQKAQITVLQELTEEEKRVIECLDSSALHIDLLALNLKMPISRISVILLTMELKGLIRSLPGNKYGVV